MRIANDKTESNKIFVISCKTDSMASRVLRAVDDITKCPICLKVMCHPAMLPCFHAFCSECLQRYLENEIMRRRPRLEGARYVGQRLTWRAAINCSHLPGKIFLEKMINFRNSRRECWAGDVTCGVCLSLFGDKILSFVPEDLTILKMTTDDWNIVGKLSCKFFCTTSFQFDLKMSKTRHFTGIATIYKRYPSQFFVCFVRDLKVYVNCRLE